VKPRLIAYSVLCVSGLAYLTLTSSWLADIRTRKAQERNRLTFTTTPGPIEIPLRPMAEFDFKSREEILKSRLDAVSALRSSPGLSDMIPLTYAPLPSVFDQIESGAPWWGLHGIFFFGPGQRSISGPSEESRFLLNPLLLVGVVENQALITNESPEQFMSYYPRLLSLSVTPAAHTVEARYSVRGYLDYLRHIGHNIEGRAILSLAAYNARDFGFNFLAIDTTRSRNVRTLFSSTMVAPNLHFIHRGGSCGYPGGCNNMSPYQDEIEFSVPTLPAEVVVKLWRVRPATPEERADANVLLKLS
jgi:hypothetical protein